MEPKLYRHKKTGTVYRKINDAIDCTNIRDGTHVVVYTCDTATTSIFVRDAKEFEREFERIPSSASTVTNTSEKDNG